MEKKAQKINGLIDELNLDPNNDALFIASRIGEKEGPVITGCLAGSFDNAVKAIVAAANRDNRIAVIIKTAAAEITGIKKSLSQRIEDIAREMTTADKPFFMVAELEKDILLARKGSTKDIGLLFMSTFDKYDDFADELDLILSAYKKELKIREEEGPKKGETLRSFIQRKMGDKYEKMDPLSKAFADILIDVVDKKKKG